MLTFEQKHGKALQLLVIVGLGLVFGLHSYFTIRANTDLSEGRYALFMDEQISFDGIMNILNPRVDVWQWLYDTLDGGDYRYGRMFYYLGALVAFVPYQIWGDTGLIVAQRMLQYLLLLATYALLSLTFLRGAVLRSLAFLLMLLVPTTVYYATMPKPEPLMLFFFSLFLYFFVRNGFRVGWYYLFLGISLGAKINLLPVLPVVVFLSLWQEKSGLGIPLRAELNRAVGALTAGLTVLLGRRYRWWVVSAVVLFGLAAAAFHAIDNLQSGRNLDDITLVSEPAEGGSTLVGAVGYSIRGNERAFETTPDGALVLSRYYIKSIAVRCEGPAEGRPPFRVLVGGRGLEELKDPETIEWNVETQGTVTTWTLQPIRHPEGFLPGELKFCLNWKGVGWLFADVAWRSVTTVVLVIVLFLVIAYGAILRHTAPLLRLGFWMLLGVVVANPFLIRSVIDLGAFRSYLGHTLFNTGHGADDHTVNVLTWLRFLLLEYTAVPWPLLLLAVGLTMALVLRFVRVSFRSLIVSPSAWVSLLPLLLGVALLGPIVLFVRRLWDFYLHPGMVFLVLSPVALASALGTEEAPARRKVFLTLSLAFFTALGLGFLLPSSLQELDHIASRSASPTHLRKVEEMRALVGLFERLSERLDARVDALLDPNLYQPDPTPRFTIDRFWGEEIFWDRNYHVIAHYPFKEVAPTNSLYQTLQKRRDLYAEKISADGPYVVYPLGLDRLVVLIRRDVLEFLR